MDASVLLWAQGFSNHKRQPNALPSLAAHLKQPRPEIDLSPWPDKGGALQFWGAGILFAGDCTLPRNNLAACCSIGKSRKFKRARSKGKTKDTHKGISRRFPAFFLHNGIQHLPRVGRLVGWMGVSRAPAAHLWAWRRSDGN